MCALKTADRVSIAYVVHQLKKFVETSNDLALAAHNTHIEWNLIELMAKQNPSEQVKMPFVVDKLFEISEAETSRVAAGPSVQP
uniref:Uncharacterized protein n=1 Tax=Globisporangium ultimum (strain ATCC 200006 / CBS 805.95 / DAOM BR144) TaxID=431595 RepID=K3W576_GLOUD